MSTPSRALSSTDYRIEPLTADFGLYLGTHAVLAERRSAWQHIEVVDTPQFGRALRIDGCFMTSEQDEFFYHEPMAHLPALTIGRPRSALIIGGGDGGMAEELLKHPDMERVVLAELDGEVIEMAREWLPTIHRGAFDDPRLTLEIGDGRAWLERCNERFDQIVLDLTDPFGPAVELYTAEFYTACQRALTPGGILSLHIQSPIHRPHTMARILASLKAVFPVVRPYFQYVPLYGTLWAMAAASNGSDPLLPDADTIDRRLADIGLTDLKLYNGAIHQAMLAQPNYVRALLAQPVAPIRGNDVIADPSLDPANIPALRIVRQD